MAVSLNQHRGEIGSFYNRSTSQITELTISLFNILINFNENVLVYFILIVNMIFLTLLDQFSSCNIIYLWNFMTHLFYFRLLTSFLANFSGKFDLLMLYGDIESNPGPRPNSGESFSICDWNLNSIVARNFSKISLLKVYNAIHTYDIICLSETYLNHDTLSENDNLKIPGYALIRVDHPSNQKRGGICIYHKDFLSIKVNNVSCLKEYLNFGLSVYGKQCNITLIYHSASQSSEEFDTFLSNFELLLNYIPNRNPFVSIIIGDFNARSKNWCFSDKTTYEGKKLESLTSQCGFKQAVSDPTHILESSSSCIDLIFTSQPNLAMNSGLHSSLHPNCHHQIIHAKFNLKILYPPLYKRVVWHYQNDNLIQRSISQFKRAFSNMGVNKQISIFNKTILNIMTNLIPMKPKYLYIGSLLAQIIK